MYSKLLSKRMFSASVPRKIHASKIGTKEGSTAIIDSLLEEQCFVLTGVSDELKTLVEQLMQCGINLQDEDTPWVENGELYNGLYKI